MMPAAREWGAVPAAAFEGLKRLARERLGAEAEGIEPLEGDASDRRYVRLRHAGGTPATSVGMILARAPADGDLPFLNVLRHFSGRGLPVPRLYGADLAAGVLLLEDVGDRSLEAIWRTGGPKAAGPLYLEALSLIEAMQAGAEAPDPASPHLALRCTFDAATFARELHHTRRYAFEALLGTRAPEADFTASFSALAGALCAQPFRLTHRDFHSRNLMLGPEGRLVMLDFQDARLGPATYDLASLVFDSYVPLPEEDRTRLIRRFYERGGAALFPDAEAFETALAETALQRNLKAVGTFAFQMVERRTPRYLRHIPPTVAHIRRHLSRLPARRDFTERLAPFLDGLETFPPEGAR